MKRLLACALSALALYACGTSDSPGPADARQPTDNKADSQPEVVHLPDGMPAADAVADQVDLPDLPDLTAELPPLGCQPGEGCFLDPCSTNEECLSGWCVEHLGEGVCSQFCTEECPPGWTCKQAGMGGPDLVYVCVSNHSNLCKPCAQTTDCKAVGAAEDVCVDYGTEGSFCGGKCTTDADCPWGFSCRETVTVSGISTTQCVAETGICPCTGKSVELALSTPCEVENEYGTCAGQRVCTDSGLTGCDAAAPSIEVCNGIDDDCDGDVDEPVEDEGDYINLCDDGNPCTDDNCKGADGCEQLPLESGECMDGDPCTVADHCESGVCVGQLVDCDDGNPCTEDWCNPAGGCAHGNSNEQCDDGDPCTVADQCSGGECTGTSVNCDCQADDDCAGLEDGNLCNGTLFCNLEKLPYQCQLKPGTEVTCPKPEPGPDAICLQPSCDPDTGACSLVPDHEGFPCEDGDKCTLGDTCADGTCTAGQAALCNDGNPCTTDSCAPAEGCTFVANADACSDGDVCTLGDQCADGVCQPGAETLDCDDGNPCTTDACDPATGCAHGHSNEACEDGNVCTLGDQCVGGLCTAGTQLLDCNDGNPCTVDSCNPVAGCVYTMSQAPCDDGNACTTGDHCHLGECIASGALPCNDNNLCTDDSCEPATGCQFIGNTLPCDDGNACTKNDQCSGGWCAGAPEECDDGNPCTTDTCDPAEGCTHGNSNEACSDGNACTVGDHCANGTCQPGTEPLNCNDGNPCTTDSCDPAAGCTHGNSNEECSDGNVCTVGDHCADGACQPGAETLSCDDDNVCTTDSCDPTKGCVHGSSNDECDDGNACTEGDHCGGGKCLPGAPVDCDDGNVCTVDTCDPATGCAHGNSNEECDDGSKCTLVDVCVDGVCVGSGTPTCVDGNPCTDDTCDPEKGCVYLPNSLPCNDGDGCTLEDTCVQGQCMGTACADLGLYCVGGTCKDSPCTGVDYGGYCWHSGSVNSSCSSICGAHGGCVAQGLHDFAGPKGCEVCQHINPGKPCQQHGDCGCAAVYPGLYTSGSSWCGYNSQDCTTCSTAKACGTYNVTRYCPCTN